METTRSACEYLKSLEKMRRSESIYELAPEPENHDFVVNLPYSASTPDVRERKCIEIDLSARPSGSFVTKRYFLKALIQVFFTVFISVLLAFEPVFGKIWAFDKYWIVIGSLFGLKAKFGNSLRLSIEKLFSCFIGGTLGIIVTLTFNAIPPYGCFQCSYHPALYALVTSLFFLGYVTLKAKDYAYGYLTKMMPLSYLLTSVVEMILRESRIVEYDLGDLDKSIFLSAGSRLLCFMFGVFVSLLCSNILFPLSNQTHHRVICSSMLADISALFAKIMDEGYVNPSIRDNSKNQPSQSSKKSSTSSRPSKDTVIVMDSGQTIENDFDLEKGPFGALLGSTNEEWINDRLNQTTPLDHAAQAVNAYKPSQVKKDPKLAQRSKSLKKMVKSVNIIWDSKDSEPIHDIFKKDLEPLITRISRDLEAEYGSIEGGVINKVGAAPKIMKADEPLKKIIGSIRIIMSHISRLYVERLVVFRLLSEYDPYDDSKWSTIRIKDNFVFWDILENNFQILKIVASITSILNFYSQTLYNTTSLSRSSTNSEILARVNVEIQTTHDIQRVTEAELKRVRNLIFSPTSNKQALILKSELFESLNDILSELINLGNYTISLISKV